MSTGAGDGDNLHRIRVLGGAVDDHLAAADAPMVELDNPILIALSRFTIQDIIARESSLATVTADATIEELLAVLTERAFLSLPITDQGCVLGVVDCLDLMSFCNVSARVIPPPLC